MSNKRQRRESIRLYFKSAFLTVIAIILVVIGYFAAGFLFGGY